MTLTYGKFSLRVRIIEDIEVMRVNLVPWTPLGWHSDIGRKGTLSWCRSQVGGLSEAGNG